MQRTREEIAEIERHKYFLSEKQGYDVGWEFAEQDWDANFAEAWRKDTGCCHENQATDLVNGHAASASSATCGSPSNGTHHADAAPSNAAAGNGAPGNGSAANGSAANGTAANGTAVHGGPQVQACKKVVRYDDGTRAANGPLGRLFSKLFGK